MNVHAVKKLKIAVFDTHLFDREALTLANHGRHELRYFETRLTPATAELAKGCDVACLFANDQANEESLKILQAAGVRLLALRSAGFNHVDVQTANQLGLKVVRVPAYSPYAVAEHAVAMLMCFNRKIHRAFSRVHELNFSLDGLLGFDVHDKTIGVIGTGRIGRVFAQILRGFGCRVLALDRQPDQVWADSTNIVYCSRETLLRESDVVSLHVPLNSETRHLIDASALSLMKKTAILINTGRGALIDTSALVNALKRHKIGGACLDVYEEEEGVFFHDLSQTGIDDDLLARLLTFPNVLLTSHQGFFTTEALKNIADTTFQSIDSFADGRDLGPVQVLL